MLYEIMSNLEEEIQKFNKEYDIHSEYNIDIYTNITIIDNTKNKEFKFIVSSTDSDYEFIDFNGFCDYYEHMYANEYQLTGEIVNYIKDMEDVHEDYVEEIDENLTLYVTRSYINLDNMAIRYIDCNSLICYRDVIGHYCDCDLSDILPQGDIIMESYHEVLWKYKQN